MWYCIMPGCVVMMATEAPATVAEEPGDRVGRKTGRLEVREYAAHRAAKTRIAAPFATAPMAGFTC
ncbi:MAG: hypothetical protein EHM16_08810 [Betaproteobacteria bacterium]|nr:MAG: hypothetical protein EHM16_08810 [Betaproteobacteria bacterium]